MPRLGLSAAHELTEKDIDGAVVGLGPGVYALGSSTPAAFYVDYIGRSDDDLNGQLKRWVGGKYTHFKFGFFSSAEQAFMKECKLFHDFGETALDNSVHPARLNGSNWMCPRCGALG
jgi:hypothetical protein